MWLCVNKDIFFTASSVTWDRTLLCNTDIHNFFNILCAAYSNLNILCVIVCIAVPLFLHCWLYFGFCAVSE
jgi:hypothetical protein